MHCMLILTVVFCAVAVACTDAAAIKLQGKSDARIWKNFQQVYRKLSITGDRLHDNSTA